MFGCNDNPSARQFESAWRKLLGQHQITASESANCRNNDTQFLSVLNASSRQPRLIATSNIESSQSTQNNNMIDDDFNEFEIEEQDPLNMDNAFSQNIEWHIAAYLASVLQKSIVEGRWHSPLRCQDCLAAFSQDEIIDDEFVNLKMKTSKLRAPARSTVQICMETEMSMRYFNYEAGKLNEIFADVLSKLNFDVLFWASDFSHAEEDHKTSLIKLIMEMYIKKKHEYLSKCNTLAAHDALWRNLLKKLVHFKGQ